MDAWHMREHTEYSRLAHAVTVTVTVTLQLEKVRYEGIRYKAGGVSAGDWEDEDIDDD
jgi:hypothetical protein